MARLGRYFLPEQPLHVIQRGNNRQAIFFADEDYARYRRWLVEATADYGLMVHAYVLMTNHVHLLATREHAESLPRVMQSLGRRYVRYVNAAYRRTGTLWEGRYRAAPIRERGLFPRLLPLHRDESGARRHGGASARLSLVELAGARVGCR
jgi:REP-associated tyrosine transposase